MSNKSKDLIILIGAARSGTKAFRDLFATNSKVSVIPFDINYIWKIGNETNDHDVLESSMANKKAKKRISKFINRYFKRNNILVEKTVSNTVRVPYIQSIFPNAKFIFLYREGLDVVESVDRQWFKEVEKKYLLKKLKHVPLKQLLTYGLSYFKRNANKTATDYFWGVKTPSLIEDLNTATQIEAIAKQWEFCVGKMLKDRISVEENNLIDVFYEDFVKDPQETVKSIIKKFNLELDSKDFDYNYIKSDNVGKATSRLDQETINKIENIISETQNNVFKLKKTLN